MGNGVEGVVPVERYLVLGELQQQYSCVYTGQAYVVTEAAA